MPRCPGQDPQYWTPDDLFDVPCPKCQTALEFWKDEPTRACHVCGHVVANPRIDLGCAKWCRHGDECAETASEDDAW